MLLYIALLYIVHRMRYRQSNYRSLIRSRIHPTRW